MKNRWLAILLLLIAAVGISVSLLRGEKPVLSAPPVASEPVGPAPENSGNAQDTKPRKASEEPARAEPADPIERSPTEIRTALVAKAREMIAKDLGGVTDQDKEALQAAIREFDALMAGGLSDQHPMMLVSLAKFSRKIDLLAAYNDADWSADAIAFLQDRLSDVQALADGASTAALRKRWVRDQSRDDLPEALVLRVVRPFGPAAGTKEGLREELNKWIKSFESVAK